MRSDFDDDSLGLPPPDHTPEPPAQEDVASPLPFSLAGVDLLDPPGLVGFVARWIEAQSRRPRRNLAVAAALTAVGNVAGLRYTDDKDGVTTNLFAFCVAGSRTGKESIQQAVSEIHRIAGIAPATHGAIKSEQEIVRNLTRHQAALYVIDEIGIFLQKVKNAQVKGGAAYLDGVLGMLMAAYSKADGFMLLTGDAKDEIRKVFNAEIAALAKRIDDGRGTDNTEKRLLALQKALDNLDNGLERPFLSMIGFTTPVTFDDLVDFQTATNGFIGRALLFNERDTAPRSKVGFNRLPMPQGLSMAISQIYMAGEYDAQADAARVEYYGARTVIHTTEAARDMLNQCLEWFEDFAIRQKGQTGLEALSLGAYELVSKISLILAVHSGERTGDHVRWAFALVRRDVDEKMRLVTANDRMSDAPALALSAKIANVVDEDGETIGVIYNRMRKHKRPDVDAALAEMVKRGMVQCEERVQPSNGRKFMVYRLAK